MKRIYPNINVYHDEREKLPWGVTIMQGAFVETFRFSDEAEARAHEKLLIDQHIARVER